MAMIELNKIYCEDQLETLAAMPDGFVDLTVTSPPYDDLRAYNGYTWDFDALADALYRKTEAGGVLVWIVSDKTVDGNETGSSFKQALGFKSAGWNLWDTMIWKKPNPTPSDGRIPRYVQSFEYMFVLTKGRPKTFNGLQVPTKNAGQLVSVRANDYPSRRENGNKSFERVKSLTRTIKGTRVAHNVVEIPVNNGAGDGFSIKHPAPFPERIAEFHISSWSNPGDLVYDPFMGSGTTAKVAHQLERYWIGSEISAAYVEIANKRLEVLIKDA